MTLPPGWTRASLEDLASTEPRAITDGPFGSNLKTAHYTSEGPRVIRLQNIGDLQFLDDRAHVSEEHFQRLIAHSVHPNDVLVAGLGEHLPRACLAPPSIGPAIVKADCFRVRTYPEIIPAFVCAVLNSPQIRSSASGLISGVGRPRLNLQKLRAIQVPVPPAAEQGRIVAAIEEQFSRLDAGASALERVRQNLKRMRAAVLQAAVMGRLVEHDLSEPSLSHLMNKAGIRDYDSAEQPPNWITASVGSLARVTSGATPSRSRKDYWSGGSIPWVTSTLVNTEEIDHAKEFVTPLALRETSIKLMPPGTLLVAMYGEGQTRGRCSELLLQATTNQACAAIVVKEELQTIRPYVKLALLASYEANRQLSAGGVQPNLSVGIIKALRITLPPVAEQARICEEVGRQIAFISRLESELDAPSKRLGHLRSSILSAAFLGQLVPQNPTDESAFVLLERIASVRASSNGHTLSPSRIRRTKGNA